MLGLNRCPACGQPVSESPSTTRYLSAVVTPKPVELPPDDPHDVWDFVPSR
jgi:hypothetical protein